MKKVLIVLITLYQQLISPMIKQALGLKGMCRYSPSCSEYAKIVIGKHGWLKGGSLAVKRLASCQPFTSNSK